MQLSRLRHAALNAFPFAEMGAARGAPILSRCAAVGTSNEPPTWLKELKPRLHSLPEHPDWISYRTTYYAKSWGFCLSEAAGEFV